LPSGSFNAMGNAPTMRRGLGAATVGIVGSDSVSGVR
jgi:hypothetical protein